MKYIKPYKHKLKLYRYNIENRKDYEWMCPICNWEFPEGDYKVNKQKYPRIEEERPSQGEYNGYEWIEVHKCKRCKYEWWFSNSSC
jgi:hypothetical protein